MARTNHRGGRRYAAITVPIALSAIILAGCSGNASGDSTSGGKEEFSLSVGVANTIQENPYDTLAKQYMDENPNVTITVNKVPSDSYNQTLPTQLQAGNAADLFQTTPGGGEGAGVTTLAEAGFLAPLGEKSASIVPKGSEALLQVDGKTYGQALSFSLIGTIFNETAANGEKYPADWNGLKDACESTAQNGKSFFALAGSIPPNTGLMAQVISSTRVYAENPNWNQDRADGKTTFESDPGWNDVLNTIVDMNKAGCFQKGAEGAGFDAITQGAIQGTSLGAFIPGDAANQFGAASGGKATFTVQSFPPATGSDKAFAIGEPAYSLSMSKTSKHQEAAQKFLDWLAEPAQSEKFAELEGNLPILGLKDMDFSGTPYEPVADLLHNGDYTPQPIDTWPNAAVYDALGTGVQGLLTGQKTVEDVLKAMDTAWDK